MPDQVLEKPSEKKTPDPSQKYTIKVKGQEKEVTYEELVRLAQQGDDYAQNTKTLKDKEEALKAEEAKIAGVKVIVDEMEADPKLKEVLNKVYSDFKTGKISKSDDTKDRNLKKLDKLIEDTSDPAEREKLRDIRDIIGEETDAKALREEVVKLNAKLSAIEASTLINLNDRVEGQLKTLEDELGAEFVNKYRKDIMNAAVKYPHQSLKKLLYHFADDTEVETALLGRAKKKEKEELDRKKKGADASGGGTTVITPQEIPRNKKGQVDWHTFLPKILQKHNL